VDDHAFIRLGIKGILAGLPEWKVCGEADNGQDAVRLAKTLNPAVVLLDVSMPGITGLEVARAIRERDKTVKIILLTLHDSEELVRTAFRIGVNGYLLKTEAESELVRALRIVSGEGVYISPKLGADFVKSLIASMSAASSSSSSAS
jgi:DNA-binding NarL/FixJ family response regulator